MTESKKIEHHLDDGVLWQWQNQELEGAEVQSVQNHIQNCAACYARAEAVARLVDVMRETHRAVRPTLAEQMQLVQAMAKQFAPKEISTILAQASRRLVRWLAPAVAILAALLVLLRQQNTSASDEAPALLPEIPESRLLLATSDEQLQQAMFEMALNTNETNK
jgi:predicted anti-sigma-YlaC factor YlaD